MHAFSSFHSVMLWVFKACTTIFRQSADWAMGFEWFFCPWSLHEMVDSRDAMELAQISLD